MPGLTINTSPRSQETDNHSSRSASPGRPLYSPITPTLAAARLSSSNNNGYDATAQRQTYTHSQEPQTAIPAPPPIPIAFDENPDALALKSAISILQMQARNATRDIQSLQRTKERALDNPEAFNEALQQGEIRASGDTLFSSSHISSEDEDEENDEDDESSHNVNTDEVKAEASTKWEKLPIPQNVVRCPPINWSQYAVVGDSLDKLHRDQQLRPSDGTPQRIGLDEQYHQGGEGARRHSDVKTAAPYTPGKDKVEKMGTRKAGKR